MISSQEENRWVPGSAPVSVVMISLNEAHNLRDVLENLKGFAHEVILVDSYSIDDTVSIALEYGVRVVQRKFRGFGDQWNFAISELPISAPWTMKIDPDERLSNELKENIRCAITKNQVNGFRFCRRLWFMGRVLPVQQEVLRVWRTGTCYFTDVLVNEHPVVHGQTEFLSGIMEHHDSPDLDHWLEKQNRYTTAEAFISYSGAALADSPVLLGTAFQRRMWLKKNFNRFPLRYLALFLYHYLAQGAFRAGWQGYVWAHMRVEVMRFREYKTREMEFNGKVPAKRYFGSGLPDPRVPQMEAEISQLVPAIPRGAAYHDGLAVHWAEKYKSGGFARRMERYRAVLRAQVKIGSVWLDAGCGSGVLSNEVAELGAHVIAVDASPQMINIATASQFTNRDRLEFQEIKSIEAMVFDSSVFDGCLCSSVLEYVDDPCEALLEISRVLKPNSPLLISVANRRSVVRAFQKIVRRLFAILDSEIFNYLEFSVNAYNEAEFERELEKRGFSVIKFEYFDPILPDFWLIKPYSSLIICHAIKHKSHS